MPKGEHLAEYNRRTKRGVPLTEECKEKLRIALTGRTIQTEESKKKISEGNKGHPVLPHVRAAVAESNRRRKGWHQSESAKEKISKKLAVRSKSKDISRPEMKLRELLLELGIPCEFSVTVNAKHRAKVYDARLWPSGNFVEMHGCFYHGCPIHYPQFSSKIKKNDELKRKIVEELGFKYVVIWEHEIMSKDQAVLDEVIERLARNT